MQVVELLQGVAEYIIKNEPDTLKYQIHREVNKKTGVDEVIVLETFVTLSPREGCCLFLSFAHLAETIWCV